MRPQYDDISHYKPQVPGGPLPASIALGFGQPIIPSPIAFPLTVGTDRLAPPGFQNSRCRIDGDLLALHHMQDDWEEKLSLIPRESGILSSSMILGNLKYKFAAQFWAFNLGFSFAYVDITCIINTVGAALSRYRCLEGPLSRGTAYGGHRVARPSTSSTLPKLDGAPLTIWGALVVASGRRVARLSESAAKRFRPSGVSRFRTRV